MKAKTAWQGVLAMMLIALGGCASVPAGLLNQPQVSLSGVECTGLGFSNQTFVLSFDVDNPNDFALPVNAVSYGIKLGGQRFASGETHGEFTVPARGSREFAISVDLNLLSTSPELLATVREGARDEIDYELKGRFGLNLPAVSGVKYRSSGTVRLRGTATSFLSQ